MGFGSESMGKAGGVYDPPGGYQPTDSFSKGGYD